MVGENTSACFAAIINSAFIPMILYYFHFSVLTGIRAARAHLTMFHIMIPLESKVPVWRFYQLGWVPISAANCELNVC